jgi:hypothetical protein
MMKNFTHFLKIAIFLTKTEKRSGGFGLPYVDCKFYESCKYIKYHRIRVLLE